MSATAGSAERPDADAHEHRHRRRRGRRHERHGADRLEGRRSTPPTVTVPAGRAVQVVAHVTPSGEAIAGDYVDDLQGDRTGRQRLGRHPGDDRDVAAVGCRRDRADRARAARPVVDVPPVRPPMSGVGAPAAAPAVAPDEGAARAAKTDGPEPVIRTRRLTKKYGTLTAVDRLDLEVYPGEIFGLLGQNGAGKTTTILMLLGLSEPTDGEASVMGLDPAWEPREVKRRVGLPARRRRLLRRHDRPPEPALHGPPQRPAQGRGRDGDRRGPRPGRPRPIAPTTGSRPTRAACASGSASPMRWSSRPTC